MFLQKFIDWGKSRKIIPLLSLEDIRRYLEEFVFLIAQGREYRDGIFIGSIGKSIPDSVMKAFIQLGFLSNKEGILSFIQQTFQEFLLASWLFRNRVFPSDFDHDKGILYYKGAYLSSKTLMFYKEMTRLNELN
jgi:hypothetical protein